MKAVTDKMFVKKIDILIVGGYRQSEENIFPRRPWNSQVGWRVYEMTHEESCCQAEHPLLHKFE